MNTVIVLQIITIIISFLTLVSNTAITINENRKTHYVEFTTSSRIQVLNKTRELIAKLAAMTDPMVINNVSSNSEYYLQLCKIKYDLNILLKDINEEERVLKTLINTTVETADKYLKSHSLENEQELHQCINTIMSLYAIYDSTDWRFIKEQSIGKIADNKEWLRIYHHYLERYSEVN